MSNLPCRNTFLALIFKKHTKADIKCFRPWLTLLDFLTFHEILLKRIVPGCISSAASFIFCPAITFTTLGFIGFSIFIIFVNVSKSQHSPDHMHSCCKHFFYLCQYLFHFLLMYIIHANNSIFDTVYTKNSKVLFLVKRFY